MDSYFFSQFGLKNRQQQFLWFPELVLVGLFIIFHNFPRGSLEKETKGFPERDSSYFVLAASYLNKCIEKPTSTSLFIYFNWRRSDKNHTTTTTTTKNQKCLSRSLLFRMFFTQVYMRGTHTLKPGKFLMMLLVSEK